MCGGTARLPGLTHQHSGLSPRVRGNRNGAGGTFSIIGSIPACAGEPRSVACCALPSAVYPRVCGGTYDITTQILALPGLSPRVRGNQTRRRCCIIGVGSIPACAGEPMCPARRICPTRVYPRVCGGPPVRLGKRPTGAGLSPRVRGNHRFAHHRPASPGSIPACAGEPPEPEGQPGGQEVYPRVCGGTGGALGSGLVCYGLSPRVRGNPHYDCRRGQ